MISVVKYGRVISDTDQGLLVWFAPGTPLRWRVAADGREMRGMPFAEWITLPTRLDERTWYGSGTLLLMPPAAGFSVWWMWRDDGSEFAGWYVNLEQPVARWDDGGAAGVDTVDHDLDILVSPERSWQWKDEHELAERSAFPEHYWVPDPAAVRAEGRRAIALIEAGRFPFDGRLTDFCPDPSWPVPLALPTGWDRPRAW